MALVLQQREAQQQQDDEMDEELFSTFLPEPVSPLTESDPAPSTDERKSNKREISAVTTVTPLPKKPRIPGVDSVDVG